MFDLQSGAPVRVDFHVCRRPPLLVFLHSECSCSSPHKALTHPFHCSSCCCRVETFGADQVNFAGAELLGDTPKARRPVQNFPSTLKALAVGAKSLAVLDFPSPIHLRKAALFWHPPLAPSSVLGVPRGKASQQPDPLIPSVFLTRALRLTSFIPFVLEASGATERGGAAKRLTEEPHLLGRSGCHPQAPGPSQSI